MRVIPTCSRGVVPWDKILAFVKEGARLEALQSQLFIAQVFASPLQLVLVILQVNNLKQRSNSENTFGDSCLNLHFTFNESTNNWKVNLPAWRTDWTSSQSFAQISEAESVQGSRHCLVWSKQQIWVASPPECTEKEAYWYFVAFKTKSQLKDRLQPCLEYIDKFGPNFRLKNVCLMNNWHVKNVAQNARKRADSVL